MKIKSIIVILSIILILFSTIPISNAAVQTVNPGDFSPSFKSGDLDAAGKLKPVTSAIRAVGIIVAVIILMVLGIRYMLGSVEQRAEYKKTMVPYIVGIVLLLLTTTLVGVIYNAMQAVNS